MTPTVGRIVHYHAPKAEESNGTQLHPALITQVWSERCVNLMVFPDCGETCCKTSVEILDDGQDPDTVEWGRWSWPPRN